MPGRMNTAITRKKTERCLYKSETSDTKKAMNKETFEP